jgi:EmrB/QacA subfamily drug resistance transporter
MTNTNKNTTALPRKVLNQAWIIVLGAIAPMLDSTMVNIAVEHLSKSFHTGLSTVQWVITGYLLAMVVAVPFTAWLLDKFGGKRVFLAAEILFGIMSLAAACAWNIDSLIVFRLVQGFSAGLITPLLTTLLVDVAGSGAMGRLMAVVGLPMMLGPIVGPVIGGLIIQVSSWRWLFLVNVPVTICASLLIYFKLPAMTARNSSSRFDWLGLALLAGMSGTIVYGVVQASTHASFNNPTTLTYISIGLVLVGLYVLSSLRKDEQAIVPLSLFKHRNFDGSMLGLFLAGVATNGPMLLLPLFFQNLRGESVAIAGLSLLPQGIGMLLARPLVGRLIDSIGARLVTLGGLAITLLGSVPFIFFDEHSAYWLLMLVLFVRGIGAGAIVSPLMTDAFVGMNPRFSAHVSIASRIMQNVGGAFGSAFLTTIVVNYQSGHAHAANMVASSYQQGFLWAVVFTAVLALPALLLSNRLQKQA